ncbi:hypothetical protein FB645_003445 [Coemansia sp. IMI 203386]|nr:hypothetical protein FB645_003445 [Coemansia sp. IMI 203386]
MAETQQHQSSNTESSADEATHEQQDYTSQTKSKPILQIRTQPTLNLNINNSDEESVELMLARAEVANDILYRDPKRVVIEGGNVHADEGTLRSLMDVTSPTIAKPPNDSSWLDTPKVPVAVDSDAYPVYPEGDERALPEFILSSQTVAELDAVTGAWENALDQLPDGEFWRAVVDDCEGLKKRAPLHLAAKIRAGIPSRVRGVVWQTLTQARSTYLQTVYAQLVQEPSPHERVIRRDLPRTFPRIPVFKREGDEGQQRLFRILKAYSLYDAEVGYCQGLGFIIGPLIMSMDECQAFCVLVRLMETYDLRGMFTEDMAGLHLRLYQFAMLAQEIVPEVMTHLAEHGVLPAMYAPAWFLSLFAYTMPLSFVLRALDVIVAEGAPESIMRVGIALLQRNAQEILRQEDFESAMMVLNTGLYDDTSRARDRPGFVLQDAAKLSAVVTSERLVELENQYYREQGSSARAGAPRPSMSSPSPSPLPTLAQPSSSSSSAQSASSTVAANHAVMKFLGWRWGRDQKPMRDDESGSASGGHLSPRILELTDAQRARSQRLREQMLKTLQSQQNAPTTILGTVASLTPQAEGISPSSSVSSMTASPDDAPPRMSMSMSMRNNESSSDSAWRDDVLEPLQRQLHDARVTCDSHRDALVALQADHEALRAELAMAKAEKAHLAEENEQLHNSLRKMEAESNKVRQEAEYGLERSQRSEEALIQARMELAEADEEKSLLVRQLSNLRRFIASEGNAAVNASGAAGALPPSRLSKDDSCASDGVVPRARVLSMDGYLQEDASIASRISGVSAASSSQKQTSRFSISSIASNWSAIRDAITSPRQSMHSETAAAGTTASSSLSSSGGPQLVVSVQQKGSGPMAAGSSSASPLSPALSVGGGSKPSSIPLAMLHRSKTIGSTSTTTTTATMSGSKSPPIA